MDPASLLGMGLVLIGVFVGGLMDGVVPVTFFGTPASFLIVLVQRALGATFFSNTMADAKNLPKMFIKAIKGQKLQDTGELIDQIVSFAEQARLRVSWPSRSEPARSRTRSSDGASSSRSTAPIPTP